MIEGLKQFEFIATFVVSLKKKTFWNKNIKFKQYVLIWKLDSTMFKSSKWYASFVISSLICPMLYTKTKKTSIISLDYYTKLLYKSCFFYEILGQVFLLTLR